MTCTQNPYVRAAVDSEIETLRMTSSGRGCAAFRAAAAIGRFVGACAIDYKEAEHLLCDAALQTGLPEREALGHIRRGLRCGERTPRTLPADKPRDQYKPSFGHSSTIERVPARPPKAEVEALWGASQPVGSDAEVRAWFAHRFGADCASFLERAEIWHLARAMPEDLHLPRWAWSRGGPWTQTGHRILFRLWDHTGKAVSIRARCVDPARVPKSLAPAGFSVRSLVLADPLGAQLLAGDVPEWWESRDIVISEGEPDWLLWSAGQREAELQGPACLGIEAGAWCQEIADRIPDGAKIALRTHGDAAGRRYARQIVESLRGRCRVFRTKLEGEGVAK
jgi:hypothetical protein